MRVLCFGDSNTQGFWDSEGGWVQRLRKSYDTEIINALAQNVDRPTVFNLGISGDKSDSVLRRMANEIEARRWHDEEFMLVFAVGVNNSYVKNGEPYGTVEQYAEDVDQIITVAKQYATKILFLELTPCDEARTNPVHWDNIVWTNQRIDQFNNALRAVCEKQNVPLAALIDAFRQEQSKRNLLSDGLHPNNDGHQFIADIMRHEIDTLLS